MTIRIRPAVSDDTPAILGFIRDLAAYEKLADAVIATEADLAARLFCDAPKVFCLIAELNGEPCGFALYFYSFSTFLGQHGIYLEDLFVREDARGHGAGTALLTRLAQQAVSEGCGRLEWSVLDWNAPSIAFYEGLGARAMEGWSVYRLSGDTLAARADRPGAGTETPALSTRGTS